MQESRIVLQHDFIEDLEPHRHVCFFKFAESDDSDGARGNPRPSSAKFMKEFVVSTRILSYGPDVSIILRS